MLVLVCVRRLDQRVLIKHKFGDLAKGVGNNESYFFIVFSVHLDKPTWEGWQEAILLKKSVLLVSAQKKVIFDKDLEDDLDGKLADLETPEPEEGLDGLNEGVEGGEA